VAIYLQEEEVAGLLDMPSVMAAVEAVMAAHARGEVVDYPRQRVRLPTSMTHMLQGAVPDKRLTGFKVYTSSGAAPASGCTSSTATRASPWPCWKPTRWA